MEKHLTLPLTEEIVKELNIGDIVYLSGEVIQLLSPAHKRALEYKKQGKELPFDVTDMAIYHCYTSLSTNECGLNCNFLGASTSAGVNLYEPDFIREFKVRAIIGKGGMNQATLDAMQEIGCVYLAQIGGCCQLVTEAVEEVTEKFWEDLAANLGIKITFKNLGPLIVGMDAKGNSIYREMQAKIDAQKQIIYQRIGIA